jgi:16S rRNA (guanine527-N7)-methyltransferase
MRVALADSDLPPSDASALLQLEELLRTEAVPRGFVSAKDGPLLRQRHIEDSLRAAALIRDTDSTAVDLGSGAGLPGVVVAIVRRDLSVTLTERNQRRAAFLETVVERLRLANVRVFPGGAEDVGLEADVCFARAFAPLPRAWRVAIPLLRPGGRLIYFAGAGFDLRSAPGAVVVDSPRLASTGPLVIMSR